MILGGQAGGRADQRHGVRPAGDREQREHAARGRGQPGHAGGDHGVEIDRRVAGREAGAGQLVHEPRVAVTGADDRATVS